MINVSVLSPFFRAKYIGWLAMESLVRQEGIDFEWELIVVEELNDETFGKDRISEYMPRLKQIGCVGFEYIGLTKWITLAAKRKLLIKESNINAKLMINNSADYYSPPKRLSTMWKLKKRHPDADWFIPISHTSYDIATDVALQRKPVLTPARPDMAGQTQSADLMRKVVWVMNSIISKGVDSHLWKSAYQVKPDLKFIIDKSDNWKYGINTNGFNNISYKKRDELFKNPETFPDYEPIPVDIDSFIPAEVMERLRTSKKYLHLHKRGLPTSLNGDY